MSQRSSKSNQVGTMSVSMLRKYLRLEVSAFYNFFSAWNRAMKLLRPLLVVIIIEIAQHCNTIGNGA